MSRTFKRAVKLFRHPKGGKQATAAGARRKAVPPNAWDDIMPEAQAWIGWKIASRVDEIGEPKARKALRKRGYAEREIDAMLRRG
jgi:hypothetical protein